MRYTDFPSLTFGVFVNQCSVHGPATTHRFRGLRNRDEYLLHDLQDPLYFGVVVLQWFRPQWRVRDR